MAPGDEKSAPQVVIGVDPGQEVIVVTSYGHGGTGEVMTRMTVTISSGTQTQIHRVTYTGPYREVSIKKGEQELHEKTHWQQFNKTAFGNKRKKR